MTPLQVPSLFWRRPTRACSRVDRRLLLFPLAAFLLVALSSRTETTLSHTLTARPRFVFRKSVDAAQLSAHDVTSSAECGDQESVTVVTAYWNIGEMPKKDESNHKHPKLYYEWLRFFKNLENPMVGFFDDVEAASIFRAARGALPTAVVMTNKSAMWSFGLAGRIKAIIDRPDYPKWMPNTVYPLYSCVMHAKFESIKLACERNYFRTDYIAWLDVGLFRDLAEAGDRTSFRIGVPPGHDGSAVAFDEVRPLRNLSVERIMKDSPVWVAGGFFVARRPPMALFADEYVMFTERLLARGLANVDQSVIMAMYCPQNAERPLVGVQTYPFDRRYDPWFSLAYLLRERDMTRRALSSPKRFA